MNVIKEQDTPRQNTGNKWKSEGNQKGGGVPCPGAGQLVEGSPDGSKVLCLVTCSGRQAQKSHKDLGLWPHSLPAGGMFYERWNRKYLHIAYLIRG